MADQQQRLDRVLPWVGPMRAFWKADDESAGLIQHLDRAAIGQRHRWLETS